MILTGLLEYQRIAVVERFRTKGMSIEHIAEKMDVTEMDVYRMLEE